MNDITQIKRLAFDVVEHAAGGTDHEVDPAGQGAELPLDRLAAERPRRPRHRRPA